MRCITRHFSNMDVRWPSIDQNCATVADQSGRMKWTTESRERDRHLTF
jgi:hypothetical protein